MALMMPVTARPVTARPVHREARHHHHASSPPRRRERERHRSGFAVVGTAPLWLWCRWWRAAPGQLSARSLAVASCLEQTGIEPGDVDHLINLPAVGSSEEP